jgi:hypothetical protein
MYRWAVGVEPSRWTQVEGRFLAAMWGFDKAFAAGLANQGDNQNGKGDYFTDLIALILEHCSGKELHGRGAVPGLIFPNHNLDTSYPKEGTVEILIETKIAGAPKSDRNLLQKNPLGRPGELGSRQTDQGGGPEDHRSQGRVGPERRQRRRAYKRPADLAAAEQAPVLPLPRHPGGGPPGLRAHPVFRQCGQPDDGRCRAGGV